jgi:uncharacterized membrane protein
MATLIASSEKKNFSKYDPSGTDPNRYGSVTNAKEADSYLHRGKKSIVPGLRVNVGKTERAIMIAAGAYLLYRVLKKNDKSKIAEGITAGTMLFRGISGYCPAYDAIDRAGILKTGNISITASLTINKGVADVYAAWRDLESLPKFMTHIDSVTETDPYKSEWKAKIPGGFGATVSWKAEILMDEPNQILSWHSLPESGIHNAGKVRFTPTGAETTDIDVTISYHAPLGKAGEIAGKLLTPVFEKMIESDIANFKEYVETGKVAEV